MRIILGEILWWCCKMDNLVSKINFFSNNALFEEIKDSNSGAILKKLQIIIKLIF